MPAEISLQSRWGEKANRRDLSSVRLEMKFLHLFLSFGLVVSSSGQESSEVDFIRYLENPDGTSSLQTAVARFAKNGSIVDLVSVVHLADSEYFDRMNGLLANYDAVLYEMVGGQFNPNQDAAIPSEAGMPDVRSLQKMATTFLGLEYQLDGIDYTKANFVHADIDWVQYQELMVAKNQTFATLFTRALNLAQEGDAEDLPTSEINFSDLFSRILTAVRTGDGSDLKRSLAPMLGDSEDFITQLEGEEGTVIVSERNKVVLQKLSEEMKKDQRGMYAIFYGGGHMPDLERRLLAEGYRKEAVVWMDAWAMDAEADSTGEAGPGVLANPGEFLLELLEQNPEVLGILQQLGTALEGLE